MVVQDNILSKKYGNNIVTLVDSTGAIHIHDKSPLSSIKSTNKYFNFKSSSFLSLNKELKVKLEAEKAIKEYGLGSYGIFTPYHAELTEYIEKIYGEDCSIRTFQNDIRDILFNSLVSSQDFIFIDEQLNTSFKQTIKSLFLEKGHIIEYTHNTPLDLKSQLKAIQLKFPTVNKFIITEGVFENIGDVCYLNDIMDISKEFGCTLVLDESNALGVIGQKGFGSYDYHQCQQKADIIFCSMDKTLCSSGQFYVFNNKSISILLKNNTSLFDESIYYPINALSAAVAKTVLNIIFENTTDFKNITSSIDVHTQLVDNINYWKQKCQSIGLKLIDSPSAITSIIIDDVDAESLVELLFKNNIKCSFTKQINHNINTNILKFNILRSMTKKFINEAFNILQSVLINYYPHLIHMSTIPKEIQIENMIDPTQQTSSLLNENIIDSSDVTDYPKAYPKFAIIGTGIRLPGDINNKDDFWKVMIEKKVITGLTPEDRWDRDEWYCKTEKPGTIQTLYGGFIENAFDFDNKFFSISQKEALDATPEQRWLCELTVETIEDANINIDKFKGSNTGVFVGTSGIDYGSYVFSVPEKITKYTYSGIEPSIHANRVSYLFDLHGPSLSTNTACSSSLTALSIACNSMAAGDCEMAIVAGTNFFQAPANGVAYSQLRVVSKKGACRPFDSGADGYARLEGAGMVLLKPYEKAIRDNNKIYATILSTACNEDGKTASLTTPSSKAQYKLMKRVYEKGHIDPCTIDFIEAHGTGTAVGDPIEASSIGEAYGKINKANGNPAIPVGSVKGNVGHGEYLSGIIGLIKSTLILHKNMIVPQTAFDTLNPKIECEKLGIRIANKIEKFPGQGRHRVAVNSFGFGGANANAIIEEEPQFDKNNISVLLKKNKNGEEIPCPYVAFFSNSSLRLLKETLKKWLSVPEKELLPMIYLNSTTRTVLAYRIFIFAKTTEEFYRTIRNFIADDSLDNGYKVTDQMMYIETKSNRKKGTLMAFDEPLTYVNSFLKHSTYYNCCRNLYCNNKYFSDCIDYCDGIFKALSQRSLLQDYGLFTTEMMDNNKFKKFNSDLRKDPLVMIMFGGMVQLTLSALLKYYGLFPNAVIGYGAGEIVAAYVADKMDLKTTVKVLYHYGRVLSHAYSQENKVYTLTLICPISKIKQTIFTKLNQDEKDGISISGIPSPKFCLLSGDYNIMKKVSDIAKSENIAIYGAMQNNYGLHSMMINDKMKEDLVNSLKDIPLQTSDIAFFTTTKLNKDGKPYEGKLDGEYWWMNMRNPVLYAHALSQTVAFLPIDGKNIIEIGFGFDSIVLNDASSTFYEKERIYNLFTFDKFKMNNATNYDVSFVQLIHFMATLHGYNVTNNLDYNHLWESYVQVVGGHNTLQQLYSMHYDIPTRCWNHKYLRKYFKAERNGLPGNVDVGIKTEDIVYLEKLNQKDHSKSVPSKEETMKKEDITIKSEPKRIEKSTSAPIKETKTVTNDTVKPLPKAHSTSKIVNLSAFQAKSSSSSSSNINENSSSHYNNSSNDNNKNHSVHLKQNHPSISNPIQNKISTTTVEDFATEDDEFWSYENNQYLVDHKVNNQIVFPAAGSVSRAMYGFLNSRNSQKIQESKGHVALTQLEFTSLSVFQKRAEDQLNSKGPIPMKLYEDKNHQFTLKHQDGSIISKGNFVEIAKEFTDFPNLSDVVKSCTTVMGGKGIHKDLIYQRAAAIQLQYGPEFQLIQSGRSGRNYSYVKIRVTEEHSKMICHPAVLDNCFHSIITLGLGSGNRQVLPHRIKSIEMTNGGHFKPGLITCVSQLIYQDLDSVIINFYVYDEEGHPLSKISNMEFLVRKINIVRPLDWHNVLKYEKVKASEQKSFSISCSQVVIMGSAKQADAINIHIVPTLSSMNLKVYLITENHNQTIDYMLQNNFITKTNTTIVDVTLLDDTSITTAFTKIQYYVSQGLNLIIGNIIMTNAKVEENIESLFTASNTISSMLRVARAESRDCHMYSIQANSIDDFAKGLFSGCLGKDEPDVIYSKEYGLHVPRLVRETTIPTIHSKNVISEPKRFGNINKTIFRKTYGIPDLSKHEMDKESVVVKVSTISLQNNDILQNSLPDLSSLMKDSSVAECIGTIVHTGSNVKNFKKGDVVFGLNLQANDIPSTYVKIHQDLVFPVNTMDMDKQNNLLSSVYAYTVAIYLLNEIPTGESVLISTDASDLMQALATIAQQKGINLFIDDTSSKYSKANSNAFKNIKAQMINTRQASEYVRLVKQHTNGEGVGVIIDINVKFDKENTLEKCLRIDGEYIKVGNIDQSTKKRTTHKIVQMSHFKDNVITPVVRQAVEMIIHGKVEAIDLKTYPVSKINSATLEILSGRLQGKSCLEMCKKGEDDIEFECLPSRVFKENKSYLITGAFGGIGLKVGLWMQLRGARHIVLTTSSDPESKYKHPIVNALRQKGVHVTITKCDISKYDEVEKLFMETTPAIDGVFHFANKFGPKLIRDSSLDSFNTAFEPKARGALNLHKISQKGFSLSSFVLFSSVLDILGNSGQMAYGAANSYLNNLIYYRRRKGLSGQCFSLPAMKGSGYLSQWNQITQSREFSEVIEFLDSEDLPDILDFFLRDDVDPCLQLLSGIQINDKVINKHIAPITNIVKYKIHSEIDVPQLIQNQFPPLKFRKILEDKEQYILDKYVRNTHHSPPSSTNSSETEGEQVSDHSSYSSVSSTIGDNSNGDSSAIESNVEYISVDESIDSDKTLRNHEDKNKNSSSKKKYMKNVNDNKHVFYKHIKNGIYSLEMKNHYMDIEYAEELGQVITKLSQLKKMQALIIEYEEDFSKGLEPSLKDELLKKNPSKSKMNEVYKIYFNCLKLTNLNVPVISCLNGEITDHIILISLLSQWKIATRRSVFASYNNPVNISWMKELAKNSNNKNSMKLIKQVETEKISAITAYKHKYINDIAANFEQAKKNALEYVEKLINNSENIVPVISIKTEDIVKINKAIKI
ncbi:hypothetical protein BCR36DRAFT_414372 [Piromyces finnis]|uniref:Ketoacyl-synt-domain-containing protein n=1 Tax=Piromyces finnis TaxID=1754191 RepID=A0A1Y1V2H3_9FUNG|nr:hypothetical protein BCR36DRAFT_414372 [Piromyces finnis]|eukprot:ORX45774.1 hypothetical protein BCR36DRAFT_414372 [Piromyces finnis]